MDSKLPPDMITEILSRTSLKTLDTMRCTSKESDTLTYDSHFLNMYKQRNNVISRFLIQNIKRFHYVHEFAPAQESNDLDLGFLPCNARVLAASEQGIMVFESPHRRHHHLILYHVCKPATRQVLGLPNPKMRYITEKVAIVVVGSKPLHYKILKLSRRQNENVLQVRDKLYSTYRCEIFDSITWAWRLLDLMKLPFCIFPTPSPPITTRGSIYMLLTDNNIFKFDAYSENWTTFSSPTPTLDYPLYTLRQLVKYEGKLAFACRPPDHGWEIWVVTIDESWERIYVFNKKEDIGQMFLDSFYDSDTSVMIDYNTQVFYKFKEGSDSIKVVLSDKPYLMLVFRSDFEIANLTSR